MSLFQLGDFKLASGQTASWKIECDALTDEDWRCVAYLIAKRYHLSEVHGVPTGGTRLAEALQRYTTNTSPPHCLIVDDVYTTGGSIRAMREQLLLRPNGGSKGYMGCVLFAREPIQPADSWVTAIFQMWGQS